MTDIYLMVTRKWGDQIANYIADAFYSNKGCNMPYKSKAQERWAHTEKGKKALGGDAKVAEWDSASKGRKLPEKAPAKKGKK